MHECFMQRKLHGKSNVMREERQIRNVCERWKNTIPKILTKAVVTKAITLEIV